MMNNEGAKPRFAWVDYSKGICIVAVVGLYATSDLARELARAGVEAGRGMSLMEAWVEFARPFRMPDFFLLSGLFLGRVIDRPWRDYLDKKVLHYLYFFVLWTAILFAFRWALGLAGSSGASAAQVFLNMLVQPFAMLWFIQMLAVYFVVTRLTRRLPKGLMLTAAALLQSFNVHSEWSQLVHFGERYVYFYAGYALAPWVFQLVEKAQANRRTAVAGVLLWAIINGYVVHRGLAQVRGISLSLGFAGALAVMVVGGLLSQLRSMDWLRHLGEHSIVTYLGFYLPMSAATILFARAPWRPGFSITAALITVFSIACAMALYRATRHTAARFLFVRPAWAKIAAPPSRRVVEPASTT